MRILIDTNILVRLRDASSPDHSPCREALKKLQDRQDVPCLCAQVLIEYWVVATRPTDVNGLGLSPAQAEIDLRDFEQIFSWLPEPPDISHRWRALVTRYAVAGRPAHDARLVALMQAHGITQLLTLNTGDFTCYAGVTPIKPSQL